MSIHSLSRSINYSDTEKTIQNHFLEHPVMAHYLQTGDSKAYKLSDFLSEKQLHRSEGLYHKFLRPLGLEDQMGFILPASKVAGSQGRLSGTQEVEITLSLHWAERSFSEHNRTILNLLRLHLLQAYQNAQAVTQIQQELTQLSRTVDQLGTISLTSEGKVQLITQKAWMLLKQHFPTQSHSSSSLPENLQRWVNHQIALQTQEDGIPPCCFPLQLGHNGRRLSIRFIAEQTREQYLLLLEEHQITPLTVSSLELLGLTRREAEVLFWVTQDRSDVEIASELGLSVGTVKKHLEHIYQKFEVHTRTSAVMHALRSLGILG